MSSRASVIAHRGASGYLPEHTAEAKVLAHAMGADFIEQDVVATRDAQLVVLHDIYLDDVTDVAAAFPGRARNDGRHYVVDFDLAEIRRLSVIERRRPGSSEPLFPNRGRVTEQRFRIATLAEEIALIQGLNRTTGREAGLYPEVKEPAWHHDHGIDLARLMLAELQRFGYRGAAARAYVQCFDAHELERMREELGTTLPLVQLLPASGESAGPPELEAFASIAECAQAVGLPFEWTLGRAASTGAAAQAAPLMAAIRSAGLAAHVYTLRRDRVPEWARSFEDLLRSLFVDARIDGVFCDHPDVALRIRDAVG